MAELETKQLALSDNAARQLANATKTVPQLLPITPRWLVFRQRRIEIDRVLEFRPAVAVNTGGHGLRYTIRVGQRKAFLFLDDAGRWFVEEKVPHEIPRVGGIVQGDAYSF